MASNAKTNIEIYRDHDCAERTVTTTQPLLAATIVLVRDRPNGYEVFMIERPAIGAFPELYVFPGGKVEHYDSGLDEYCPTLTDEQASQLLNLNENGLRFWVGVIRECFEECGVLYAHQNGELLATRTEIERQQMQHWARQISSSPEQFRELLAQREFTLATDELVYFSHWITPERAPNRFNTRFFLSKLPPEQRANAQTNEVASSCWIRPKEALRKYATKSWRMILPTLTTLRMLCDYANTDDLITQVRTGYHKIPVRLGKQLQGMQPFPLQK